MQRRCSPSGRRPATIRTRGFTRVCIPRRTWRTRRDATHARTYLNARIIRRALIIHVMSGPAPLSLRPACVNRAAITRVSSPPSPVDFRDGNRFHPRRALSVLPQSLESADSLVNEQIERFNYIFKWKMYFDQMWKLDVKYIN